MTRSMRLGDRALITFAMVCLANASAMAADPPPLDVPGFEAITASAERNGDRRQLALALVDVVVKASGSEAAELALLRLDDLEARAASARAELDTRLRAALAKPPVGPLWAENRHRLLSILARIASRRGAWEELRGRLAEQGWIRSWLVVGPFGFTTRAVHDRAFGPETALKADEPVRPGRFQGRYEAIGWTPLRVGDLETALEPSRLHGVADGAVYALAQVRGPKGARCRVTVASPASFKVFWQGDLVLDIDRADAYEDGEVSFLATLGEGWQRLVVKVAEGDEGLAARIVAEDGKLLAGLEVLAEPRIEPLGTTGSATRTAARKLGPEVVDGLALAAEGLRLQVRGLLPDALVLYERACAAAPERAHLHALLARATEDAEFLPDTERRTRSRAAYTRALEADPAFLPAKNRSARFAAEDGRPDESYTALLRLYREHSVLTNALAAAAEIAGAEGWRVERDRALAELRAVEPEESQHCVALADRALDLGNRREERELLTAALGLDASRTSLLIRLADREAASGTGEAAIARLTAVAQRFSENPAYARRLARAMADQGRLADAASRFEEIAAKCLGAPGDFESAGACLLEAAERAVDREAATRLRQKAIASYRAALAKRPGRYELRRVIAKLEGAPDPDDPELHLSTAEAIAAAPPKTAFPRAHSVCLLDHAVTVVYPDGSFVERVHQVFELRDADGVKRYHTVQVPGEPLAVRTHAPDGRIYEPVIQAGSSEVLMPKLEPGARIELCYRRGSTMPPAFQLDLGPFYFGDPNLEEPYVRSRWDVLVPADMDLAQVRRNFDAVPEIRERGGFVHHRFEVRDREGIVAERFMPEPQELLPWVQLVARRTWSDVAEHHREMLMGRTRLTPAIEEAARTHTAGIDGAEAKARALASFVADHVKRPGTAATASAILEEGAGSRIVLLRALLDTAGVPARFAMVSPNPALAAPTIFDPPQPGAVRMPVLLIEPPGAAPIWYTGMARFAPFDAVPRLLENGTALVLGEGGVDLRTIPAQPIAADRQVATIAIRLVERDAEVSVAATFHAIDAFGQKERLKDMPQKLVRQLAEQFAGESFVDATVREAELPEVGKAGVPLQVRYAANVRGFVRERDGRLAIPTGLAPTRLGRLFGGGATREHPIVLRLLRASEDRVRIELGPYQVAALPDDELIRGDFGRYRLAFRVVDGAIEIERDLVIEPGTIRREGYVTLLAQLERIDAAELREITLRR